MRTVRNRFLDVRNSVIFGSLEKADFRRANTSKLYAAVSVSFWVRLEAAGFRRDRRR